MTFRAECLRRAVVLGALALAGCATVPKGSLERAQEDWLRKATVLVHPHVERITGVGFAQPGVTFYRSSSYACATAGGGAHTGRIRYFKSCPRWHRGGYGWLDTVAHELVHVADRAKHKGYGSRQYGKDKYGRHAAGHGPWWTRNHRAVRTRGRMKGGWRSKVMAALPPFPQGPCAGASAGALEGKGNWGLKQAGACFVCTEPGDSSATHTWAGRCAGGVPVGQGDLRNAEGFEASGAFADGKLGGRWVMRSANGTVEIGPYVDGERNGRWIERYANGTVGEGPYVDGEPNGRWIGRFADGSIFHVCFRAGEAVDCN